MRTIGSPVLIHGQYHGRIMKEHSPTHWVVSYDKGGVRYLERVAKTEVQNRKEKETQ